MAGRRIRARVRKRGARDSKQGQQESRLDLIEDQGRKLKPAELDKLALQQRNPNHQYQDHELAGLQASGQLEPVVPQREDAAARAVASDPRALAARQHLQEHLPMAYEGMVQGRTLNRYLVKVVAEYRRVYRLLRRRGLHPFQAQEQASRETIFPPSQEEQSRADELLDQESPTPPSLPTTETATTS